MLTQPKSVNINVEIQRFMIFGLILNSKNIELVKNDPSEQHILEIFLMFFSLCSLLKFALAGGSVRKYCCS